MRLTPSQQTLLKEAVIEVCGEDAQVYVFGSKLDDTKKGGDIDLLVKINHFVSNPALIAAKIQAKAMLSLGEQKVDVLIQAPNLESLPIHEVALAQGVLL